MKVYIVVNTDPHYDPVIGVYSSKEAAKKHAPENSSRLVEEREVEDE